MDKPMSGLGFRAMSLMFRVRDLFRPRSEVLKEVGIGVGSRVLDYGCGPGGYIVPLAGLVGPSGTIYALDMHPLALRQVRKIAKRKGLGNVHTIESERGTGLPDQEVDVVLLYDVLHHLVDPDEVLRELHRVLKPGGALSVSDHHMDEEELLAAIGDAGGFSFVGKGERTFSFSRA